MRVQLAGDAINAPTEVNVNTWPAKAARSGWESEIVVEVTPVTVAPGKMRPAIGHTVMPTVMLLV